MKKLVFSLFIVALIGSTLRAQDDKKVRMGITLTPALNWITPDDAKKVTKDGSVIKMGIGLAVDFRLTDVIWFNTGLEYTGAGGKLAYSKDTAGYYYKDDAIQSVSPEDALNASSSANTDPKMNNYQLLKRNYKAGFLHIPIGFKLKTKELGGITYFGDIGGDLFIKTSSKGVDEVKYTPLGSSTEKTETITNKLGNEVNFFSAGAHVGAGLEFRLSGSTAITAAVAYRHGIMNFTNADTYSLLRYSSASTPYITEFPNGSKLRQVVLTIGIMF
jgi:hypothetical protein